MTRTIVKRVIKAPIDRVFDAIASIENFAKIVPDIVAVEYLTEQKSGVGTRMRETRLMRDQEVSMDFDVTEYEENRLIRLVTDDQGTVWDTLFEVRETADGTELIMTMDAKAYKFLPRLINPFIKGMVKKAIESDMDRVKAWCEAETH